MSFFLKFNNTWKEPLVQELLLKQEIHIWVVNLKEHSHNYRKFYASLSVDEKNKVNFYKFEKDQYQYVVTRGILRNILSRYLIIQPEDIEFSYTYYGKPYLNKRIIHKSIYFNVSHSEDLALLIFSQEREVGIDLEKKRPIEDIEIIVKYFFSDKEIFIFQSLPSPEKLKAFFRAWTRKEALIKAVGDGLSYDLNQFDVSFLLNKEPILLKIIKGERSAVEWTVLPITLPIDYEAAFAFKGKCNICRFWKFI